MAKLVSSVETFFIFNTVSAANAPIKIFSRIGNYSSTIIEFDRSKIELISDSKICKLKNLTVMKVDCSFNYKEQKLRFSSGIISIDDKKLILKYPSELYKDLTRYARRVEKKSQMELRVFRKDAAGGFVEIKSEVINLSIKGLLFEVVGTVNELQDTEELLVQFVVENRVVKCMAKVTRSYVKNEKNIIAVEFKEMQVENMRFLFEKLYGKQYTDVDAEYYIGKV
jgi:outer membrane lipopolysaccharide assembly protein LptE/RlpB